MKRILLMIMLISIFVGIASAALTYDEIYYMQHLGYLHSGSSVTDPMYLFMNEIIGYVEGSTAIVNVWLDPTDTVPDANEGRFYYHESDECLKLRTSTAWVDIDVSGASSLGTAYNSGYAITVATNPVTLNVASDGACSALFINFDEVDTDTTDAFRIDSEADDATAAAIQIDCVAGVDIRGTGDVWNVSYLGVATLVGADVGNGDILFTEPAANEVSLISDANGVLTISADGKEDIDINLMTADTLTFTSSTSVATVNWGDLDSFTGLDDITFDAAGASNIIGVTGSTTAKDLTIQQAGTGNCSLILQSAGSGTDALSLISSAADISLSSADNITRTAADNITDTTTDGGYTLTIGGAGGNGDYTCTVDDNFSTIVVGTMLLQNTEAASDITINSVLGTVIIEGEEDCADAVLITADGDTASTLRLFNDTGTSVTEGAYSIEALSDVGGVELRSTSNLAKSVALTSDGGTTGSIWIYNDQGASVTEGASSIQLLSDAGGIGLKSTANLAKAIDIMVDGNTASTIMIFNDTGTSVAECAASISIWSDVGGIEIQSDANLDDALVLRVDGGTTSEMTFHNDQGTAADSIELLSDVGGITITAGDSTTADILIDANDIITILSASLADAGIYLHANGGAAEGIYIHSDQGTSADSVEIKSDVGGIDITAEDTTAGDILIDANDQLNLLSTSLAAGGITATATTDFKVAAALCLNDAETFGATDTTPDVTGASFFLSHASTQTLTDFDGTIDTGQIIYIESTAAVTYDTDGTPGNLKGSSANIVTADGDLTGWIYNGTDWLCFLFMDVSADNSTGI